MHGLRRGAMIKEDAAIPLSTAEIAAIGRLPRLPRLPTLASSRPPRARKR